MIGTYIEETITFQMNNLMYLKNKDRLFSYLYYFIIYNS